MDTLLDWILCDSRDHCVEQRSQRGRLVLRFSPDLAASVKGDVALSVMCFPRPPHPVEEEGLVRRTGPSPVGRAFPRRHRDHFLLYLSLALAMLPPLARDAGTYLDIVRSAGGHRKRNRAGDILLPGLR